MSRTQGSHEEWSSLSSVESLADLSVPTPPPSKGAASTAGRGFRRLNARTAAELVNAADELPFISDRTHSLPSEKDIKAERYRYMPSDREIWRPAMEQLSRKISEQQHELWEVQTKLREEAHQSNELLRLLKAERKEHKEVVTALTAQLSARHKEEETAQAEATARSQAELERAWKRCAELEHSREAAEVNARERKQECASLAVKVNELQAQVAGLKVLASQSSALQPDQHAVEATNDLRSENSKLKDENEGLKTSLKTFEENSVSLKHSIDTLNNTIALLKSDNSSLEGKNASLSAELEAQTQQSAAKLQQIEEDIWQQSSKLAAEHIGRATKQSDVEIARLNDKVAAQEAIISSQKEFLTMTNAQLDYMRTLLGDSLGKFLDYRMPLRAPSGPKLQPEFQPALQPSPVEMSFSENTGRRHFSTIRQRPSPDQRSLEANQSSPVHQSMSHSGQHVKMPSELRHKRSSQKEHTEPASNDSPQRKPRSPEAKAPLHRRPEPESVLETEFDASSSDSLSTIQPESEQSPREWGEKKNPLHQSTVNHSSTSASSTSTPNVSGRAEDASRGKESLLDELYERLLHGRMSREELDQYENIYDARTDIMAERPQLDLDAKALLAELRPSATRKHAAIVSRMAQDLA